MPFFESFDRDWELIRGACAKDTKQSREMREIGVEFSPDSR